MNKNCFLIASAIMIAISTNSLHCMLLHSKYPAIVPAPYHINVLHPQQEMPGKTELTNRDATEEEKAYVCHTFTVKKVVGHAISFTSIPNKKGGPNITNLEVFFDQVKTPQAGDVVIYTTSPTDLTIQHSGVVLENGYIESKFGKNAYISEHALFSVFNNYGNAAFFFRLKPVYQTDKLVAACGLYKEAKKYGNEVYVSQRPCSEEEYNKKLLRLLEIRSDEKK